MTTTGPAPVRALAGAGVAALAILAALAPGCGGVIPTARGRERVREGALFSERLHSYHVVYSPRRGKVGYLKEMDVSEAGGPTYRWKYVYDLAINRVGRVDQFGKAYKEVPYSPFEADVQRYTVRVIDLPEDTIERNVLRMLDIDPATDDVSFPPASNADIAGK
jgi:hypothetical protein